MENKEVSGIFRKVTRLPSGDYEIAIITVKNGKVTERITDLPNYPTIVSAKLIKACFMEAQQDYENRASTV